MLQTPTIMGTDAPVWEAQGQATIRSRKRIEEIANRLQSQAKRTGVPFIRMAAEELIETAIQRAEKRAS